MSVNKYDSSTGQLIRVSGKGIPGVGITSIVKTATSANVDTYTITYTDGTAQTYTVTNGLNGTDGDDGSDGVGIASVSVNASNHLIITKTDGTSQDAGEIDIAVPIDDTTPPQAIRYIRAKK